MGIQDYRPAYLQALAFKFMFLNLPHCDGLNIIFYIGARGLVDIQGCLIINMLSKSDEGALRHMTPKNTNFHVLTALAPPTLSRSHHPTLMSSGIVLGMLMESYRA